MILFDDTDTWENLLPLTFTRSIAECRIGILTIREKWEICMGEEAHIQYCQDYLKNGEVLGDLSIVSHLLPDKDITDAIKSLKNNQKLIFKNEVLAYRGELEKCNVVQYTGEVTRVLFPWDFFLHNDRELRADFERLAAKRTSIHIPSENTVLGENIFLEEGAKVHCSILNTTTGPIYIGKNAEVMEGCMIRGPFCLGENAQLKMGAKVYGATTFGPGCKVGGEITNTVFFGNSNKAHDGYLGNSVLGEWCNLGADTNSSNLKNNYSSVEVYNYKERKPIPSHQLFCGLIMGDHSKAGINTMFNTGTVVGVSANIVGAGFPSKHIASFTWSISDKVRSYDIERSLETARIVYARRGKTMTDREEKILRHVFEHGSK